MEVEMSVDEASENEVIDNDIEDINPYKEELEQSAEEVDPFNHDDESSDEPVDDETNVDKAAENKLLDSDIDEEDINPDKEELEQAVEEVDNQVDHNNENNDERIQEPDERETTDEQVESDITKTTAAKITVKDSTKTENENKTTELPEKEIQKKIESEKGVTTVKQTLKDDDDGTGENVVLFKNLPECEQSDLHQFIRKAFKQLGGYIKYNMIQTVKSFESGRVQIVVFGNPEDAKTAVEQLNGPYSFNNSLMEVTMCKGFIAEVSDNSYSIAKTGGKWTMVKKASQAEEAVNLKGGDADGYDVPVGQFPIASNPAVQGKEKTSWKRLLVYPVTDQDLEGPLIKPLTDLAFRERSVPDLYAIRFRARRGHSKQGVLEMKYSATDNMMVQTLLSGELCGGIKPKTDDLFEYSTCRLRIHTLVERVERAWNSVAEDKATEEQPVAVFVNNIPSGVCVEMLRFLYPSACSIQLPVNSQSVLIGYAIIEFTNLKEAKNVVKNNRTYPAQIGKNYLDMYVVGHDGEIDCEDELGELLTGKPEQTGSEESQKRGISESKSSSPTCKRSRLDDRKQSSPSKKSSGNATKAQTKKVKTDLWACCHFTSAKDFILGSSCGFYHPGKPEQTGSEESQKRDISDSKSSSPKRSRLDDDKQSSPSKKSSGKTKKYEQKMVKNDLRVCRHFTSATGCKLGSSCGFYHPDDDDEMFNVFIGNFGNNISLQTLHGFLVQEMIFNGICLSNDNPIYSVKRHKTNVIAVFRSRTQALQAIKVLDKVIFQKHKLDIKAGPKYISKKPIEVIKVEYHVHFGDVPKCRATEFLNFIKAEFHGRGLCGKDENPVKKLSFKSDRNFQFAVFNLSTHATAAVEKLSGAIFKGSPVTTKFHNTDQGNAATQPLNNS